MKFKLNLIALSVVLATVPVSHARARGDASSAMQAVQNGNLISQVSKQAQLVSGQIRDYASQLNQYQTMLQNLKNIPVEKINAALRPYKESLDVAMQVGKAVDDLNTASREAEKVYRDRTAEMRRLKMDPEKYMMNEIALAEAKGGIYKQKLDADMAVLKNSEEKSRRLAAMDEQVRAISGNVEGLQTLAQQNQIMATELTQLNISLTRASVEQENKRIKSQELAKLQAEELRALDEKSRESTKKVEQFFNPKGAK